MRIIKQNEILFLANIGPTSFIAITVTDPGIYRFDLRKTYSHVLTKVKPFMDLLHKTFCPDISEEDFVEIVEKFFKTDVTHISLPYVYVASKFGYVNVKNEFTFRADKSLIGLGFERFDQINFNKHHIYRLPFPNVYFDGKISYYNHAIHLSENIGPRKVIKLEDIISDAKDIADVFWNGRSQDEIFMDHFSTDNTGCGGTWNVNSENFFSLKAAKWTSLFCPLGAHLAAEFDRGYERVRTLPIFKQAEKSAPCIYLSQWDSLLTAPHKSDKTAVIGLDSEFYPTEDI